MLVLLTFPDYSPQRCTVNTCCPEPVRHWKASQLDGRIHTFRSHNPCVCIHSSRLCTSLHKEYMCNVRKHRQASYRLTVYIFTCDILLWWIRNKTDTHVWRNIEACSCNNCRTGIAVSIICCECVLVTVVIQHAKRMRHIVIRGPPGCTVFFT